MLIYDIEIIKAIPPKDPSDRIEGIEYCAGWQDHANMGISVIGAYDYDQDKYRVFTKDNWDEFTTFPLSGATMIGFNSIPFDNAVIKASGIDIFEGYSYDLLREVWIAAGLGINYEYPSHSGYSLDAIAKANGLQGKTGNGALAPIEWQKGNIGTVIDYCLMDVAITKKLVDMVMAGRPLIDPKTGGWLWVRTPAQVVGT